jgi:hypothetical protein
MRLTNRTICRSIARSLAVTLAASGLVAAQTPAPPANTHYRGRLLGVFNAQTGDPIEGAEVLDVFSKTKALTTATGTVTLSFLPEGGSMIRVTKIGFSPETNVVPITPADTAPFMIMLRPVAQTLPTVVSKSAAAKYVSPGLRAFEERRVSAVGGKFITPEQLRKSDNRKMTDVIREIGVPVRCAKSFPFPCFATSSRQGTKYAFIGGGSCDYDVYLDGNKISAADDRDLEVIKVSEIGAVEAYMGAASLPSQYNQTGSACGALLFWTRER